MLASITPLGERGRGQSFAVTFGAFTLGSALAGTLTGALLGAIGSLVVEPGSVGVVGLVAIAVVGAVGLALEAGPPFPGRLPTLRRQVDASWLDTYRGVVYGFGFGAQLGAGVVTVVTTAAVYVWMLCALLSGSAVTGGAIGLAFGLVRGLALLPAASVRRAGDFQTLQAGLAVWDRRTRPVASAVLLSSFVFIPVLLTV